LQFKLEHINLRAILGEPVNYTWDQTGNEVVVTFNLNSIVDQSCLKVVVDEELKHLQVSVQGPETTKKIIDGIMAQEVSKEVSSTVQQGM
jgi:CS domain